MRQIHPEESEERPQGIQRRNSLMNIPMKKFAAQEFDQKAVVLCQFCGGQTCKQEDFRTNKKQPNAIEGLHSNWIKDKILAMQRPSERLIKEYNLYESFKKEKINTILNLQEPGEHPYCGDGLLSMVGFSYDPQGFFSQGISFFNESWEDMTATTFEHMMRIMNIFYMSLVKNQGKISVHCHAGRGRTLLVICSWLIYYDRMTAKATIDLAVEKREGVLTKSSQREFLSDFEEELKIRWTSFGQTYGQTFSEFIQNQKCSLLKFQQLECKFKPYVHAQVMKQLRQRIEKEPKAGQQIMMALLNSHDEFFKEKWNENHENELKSLKTKINNHTLFTKQRHILAKTESRILTELLYDFYDGLPFVLITIHALEALVDHAQKKEKKIEALFQPEFIHETGVEAISVMLDLVHFAKFLVKQNLKMIKDESEDVKMCDSLFLRLSMLMSSKRKYCHKIFPQKHHLRECKLLKYDSDKRQKYTSVDEVKLANYMRTITKEMGQDLADIDDMVMTIRKVDSNLHYFTKNHNSDEGFIKKTEVKQIFDNSRV